jgi:hypothetical protein
MSLIAKLLAEDNDSQWRVFHNNPRQGYDGHCNGDRDIVQNTCHQCQVNKKPIHLQKECHPTSRFVHVASTQPVLIRFVARSMYSWLVS